ncbi:MAG: ribonuclease E/G, partial [Pseudomonadota bacterium]
LLEMSRQRLRPGMLEATTKPCPHCHGTGRVRSDDSLALSILRELEEEGVRRRAKEVLVSVPVEIANYMLNAKREHVAMIESRFGLSVRIEGDAGLVSPDHKIERLKTATRIIPEATSLEGVIDALPDLPDEDEADEEVRSEAREEARDESAPKKRRRRRRRRQGERRGRRCAGRRWCGGQGQPGGARRRSPRRCGGERRRG